MRTNSAAERIALKPKGVNKPVRYWQAVQNGVVIDENNSVALLRFKWKNYPQTIFKAVR